MSNYSFQVSLLSVEIDDANAWFIEFLASIYMTCRKECFKTYYETNNGNHIYQGNDRSHEIIGYGDVCVTLPNGYVKQMESRKIQSLCPPL